MRKIAIVTVSRSDYGIYYPILKEIEKRKDLKLQLIVAGMHLSHEFGYTIKEIVNDKFKIAAKVDLLLSDDTGARMARSIGVGILEFTQVFEMLKPDIVVVLGDREEMFAAAISSLCLNIPVGHIHGGEVATGGHIDESIRHAITKFSHLHFSATKLSARRIISLGEETWRVFCVGAPFIDNLFIKEISNKHYLSKKYDIDLGRPVILVLQHPLTINSVQSLKDLRAILDAIVNVGLPARIIYPNADSSGKEMIELIKKYERYHNIKTYKNITSSDFLGLMKIVNVIIGNSSSAIIEAPTFCLPAINVGLRQQGREMASNIINCSGEVKKIVKAINTALYDKQFRKKLHKLKSPYGSGGASKKIVDILKKIAINDILIHKKITI